MVVQITSLRGIPKVAMAPTLLYLKATGQQQALFIKFGAARLVDRIQRISLSSL